MSIRELTEDEADIRLDYIVHLAGNEVLALLQAAGRFGQPDERCIEKLREISRVASQVAKHYEDRLS